MPPPSPRLTCDRGHVLLAASTFVLDCGMAFRGLYVVKKSGLFVIILWSICGHSVVYLWSILWSICGHFVVYLWSHLKEGQGCSSSCVCVMCVQKQRIIRVTGAPRDCRRVRASQSSLCHAAMVGWCACACVRVLTLAPPPALPLVEACP